MRTKNIFVMLLLAGMMTASAEYAYPYSIPSSSGKSGLAFLKVGVGGRNLAMGDTGVASSNDATAVFYNPALLPLTLSRGLFFSYHNFILDVNQQYVGGNFKWLGQNYFGFGLNLFTVPNIEKRDSPSKDPDFLFDSRDFSLGFSWGKHITAKLALGIGAKLVYEKVDIDDLTGYAADFGAVYDILPTVRAGAAVKNVGPKVKFISEKFDLPREFRLGLAYHPQMEFLSGQWIATGDLVKSIDADLRGQIGMEYSYEDVIMPRLGYSFNYSDKDITAGFGLKYRDYAFDYAFVPYSSNLGNSHHLTLGLIFR
ncbi:MAG: hypothetical protein CO189_08090 [candidate division Zixibacteria bacterium CG_4_9_14_3_um_filter_46_8]|nr:MAG: hypothetical protein CO189_08090 [candidate division Zixibacteria bacterium CG_4_9_14_3_um_filter_46_8]